MQVFNAEPLVIMMGAGQLLRRQDKGTEPVHVGANALHMPGIGAARQQAGHNAHAGKMHLDGGGQRVPAEAPGGGYLARLLQHGHVQRDGRAGQHALYPAQQLLGFIPGQHAGRIMQRGHLAHQRVAVLLPQRQLGLGNGPARGGLP